MDRVLEPITNCLTPDVAAKLVAVSDAETQARVDGLAEKATEGTLSAEERTEYDRYREAFHFVSASGEGSQAPLRTAGLLKFSVPSLRPLVRFRAA